MRKHVVFSVCLLVLSIMMLVYASIGYATSDVDATASISQNGSSGQAAAYVQSFSSAVDNGWYNIYASVGGGGPSDNGPFQGTFFDYVGKIGGGNAYAYASISGRLFGFSPVSDLDIAP